MVDFLYLKEIMQQANPGLSPAVQEAISRRGGTGGQSPQMNQVSPDARTPNVVSQPTNPSDIQTAGVPSTPKQEFQPTTQDDLIILTLTEQLGRNNKLEKEKMKMSTEPTTPQTPPQGDALAPNPSSPMQQQGNYPF